MSIGDCKCKVFELKLFIISKLTFKNHVKIILKRFDQNVEYVYNIMNSFSF